MNVNSINSIVNGFTNDSVKSAAESTADTFSRMLNNLKNGLPADYDADQLSAEGTTITTQIMSDGSVMVTVTDADGNIISQNKTRAMNPDPNAHIIDTIVENKGAIDDGAFLLNMLGAKFL